MPFVPKVPEMPAGAGLRQQHAAQLKAEMDAKKSAAVEAGKPHPGLVYTFKEGDKLDAIARQVDQHAAAIWHHEDNAGLRERLEDDPGRLAAGDEIFIPEEEKEIGPVGKGDYVVKDGDCISSIAKDTGHFWEKIWNDPENEELKTIRENPNVLLPGDRVTIPEIITKEESGATEERHRLVRRGEPAKLHIQILRYDEPRSNEPYEFNIDGTIFKGNTDGEGNIALPIPGNAQRGELVVGPPDDQAEYTVNLGELAPITEMVGVQSRLNNLGFDCGAADGHSGSKTEGALRRFQGKHDLPETAKPDPETREKLLQTHGS